MNLMKMGITQQFNSKDDEDVFTIGFDGNMPIALFWLIASAYKNGVARYFNLMIHTQEANEWQKKLMKQKLNIEFLINKFDEVIPVLPPPKDQSGKFILPVFEGFKPFNLETLNTSDYDAVLPLHLYSKQFAQLFAMKTSEYESGCESTIMTCPMSYIKFWGREEFQAVHKSIDVGLEHILNDVMRIMQIREIKFNSHSMTVDVPEYKSFVLKKSLMW